MRRKEQRSMLALVIIMAVVVGVFLAEPVGAGNGPVGAAAPAPVEKTGQIEFYATGDDGDLEKGVAWPGPRFTDNEDGTVTDNLTGLIWLKNANCFDSKWWGDALDVCNNLSDGSCGLTDGSIAGDWRLPNVKELESLIHFGFYDPALPDTAGTGQLSEGDPFSGVQSGSYYWSSTTSASNTDYAWSVSLDFGLVFPGFKLSNYYVWPVRGMRGNKQQQIPPLGIDD